MFVRANYYILHTLTNECRTNLHSLSTIWSKCLRNFFIFFLFRLIRQFIIIDKLFWWCRVQMFFFFEFHNQIWFSVNFSRFTCRKANSLSRICWKHFPWYSTCSPFRKCTQCHLVKVLFGTCIAVYIKTMLQFQVSRR